MLRLIIGIVFIVAGLFTPPVIGIPLIIAGLLITRPWKHE